MPGRAQTALRLTDVTTATEGDALHVAYEVRQVAADGAESSFVVVDGTEGTRYDEILGLGLKLSPEGAATYVARRGRHVRVGQAPET